MGEPLGDRWRNVFWTTVQEYETAQRLRDAAVIEKLKPWTQELTAVVVNTCRAMGWQACAKGSAFEISPVPRQEYLALDVMSFAESDCRWRFPVAVMELENSRRDDVIAYSLWKVLCVRAELRIVFCYRGDVEQNAPLLRHLNGEVIQVSQ